MADVTLVSTSTPVETAVGLLSQALEPRHRFAIAGGSALAALEPLRQALGAGWSTLKLTWVDERVVNLADSDSNRGQGLRSGALAGVGLELPLVKDGESGAQAVERVCAEFARDFNRALDVALLGMGDDGHVASLFSGHRLLDERVHDFAWLDDAPKPPARRVTMTLRVLAQSSLRRIVLVRGASKRHALERLLDGDARLPISLLGPLTVVTDQRFTFRKGRHV